MSDPKILRSSLSGPFESAGVAVDVEIYRLENNEWSLEVVSGDGTSTVWEDLFPTDTEAHQEFLRTVADEGMIVFLRDPADTVH